MSTFDEREKAFENKFKRDQELQFKVTARRNKLLGLWAAEQMGIKGDAAEAYAKEIVAADLDRAGDSDVVDRVLKDFAAKGVDHDASKVRREMERLMGVAKEQVAKQG
ncbi:MAG: DUF1476 domain-containing protein [Alphaproteobacteria bacterium]|nr:DUF1476 domain-containing protein [Alphaproteobacteria bacterium]